MSREVSCNKELNVSCNKEKEIDIIHIVGPVRPDTIEPLQKKVQEILPSCSRLIVEIIGNDFATVGVTLLAEIASFFEKNKGVLAVVTVDEFYIETFEICDLTPKHFKIFPSCKEAIDSLLS